MAWQVALVLDDESDASLLLGQMPVWVKSTPARAASAPQTRQDWGELWHPDPAWTLINPPIDQQPSEAVAGLIPIIEMHHPTMVCVRLFGVPTSEKLTLTMASLGYSSLEVSVGPGVGFAKPADSLIDLHELDLDAEGWVGANDIYDAFFLAVGAPEWHGRNFSALIDSISTGGMNKVEVPYRLVIRNASHANAAARQAIRDFGALIHEVQATGCPVSIVVHE